MCPDAIDNFACVQSRETKQKNTNEKALTVLKITMMAFAFRNGY